MLRLVYREHQSGPRFSFQLKYQAAALTLQATEDLVVVAYARTSSLHNFLYVTHETMGATRHLRGSICRGPIDASDGMHTLEVVFIDKDVSLLLPSKEVTISFVKRRGCLDSSSGYHGVAHFNVRVKPMPTAVTHVSIVEADNGDSTDNNNNWTVSNSSKAATGTGVTGELSQLVSRPVGDSSIMRLPNKRPRSYKLAVYESQQQRSKRPTAEDTASSSDPFYFHKEVFDDDEVIELPPKR